MPLPDVMLLPPTWPSPLLPLPDPAQLIIKTLGPPSEDDLTFITSQKARAYIRALPPSEVGTRRSARVEHGGAHLQRTPLSASVGLILLMPGVGLP